MVISNDFKLNFLLPITENVGIDIIINKDLKIILHFGKLTADKKRIDTTVKNTKLGPIQKKVIDDIIQTTRALDERMRDILITNGQLPAEEYAEITIEENK